MILQLGKYLVNLSKINYIDLGAITDLETTTGQFHIYMDNKDCIYIDLAEIDVLLKDFITAWGSL